MNTVAEIFPPGEFLREELEARGWSQTELAEIIGRPVRLINEIIAGKKAITPETAIQLGQSLGTGPELWMNLESQYQLSRVRETDGLIARRAKLYERFPVREMIKRGWIEASKSIEVLEQQFLAFFSIDRVDADIAFCHAAKKAVAGCSAGRAGPGAPGGARAGVPAVRGGDAAGRAAAPVGVADGAGRNPPCGAPARGLRRAFCRGRAHSGQQDRRRVLLVGG